MPVIENPGGSVNPNAGFIAEAEFQPNTITIDGVRGHVPGPPAGTPATYVLRADGTWGVGGGGSSNLNFVPVIKFTGSATGTAPQTFTDPNLALYSQAQDIDLYTYIRVTPPALHSTVVRLFGGATALDDFTLNALDTSITLNVNIPANALVFINSKAVPIIIVISYYLHEFGDRVLLEDGSNLMILE